MIVGLIANPLKEGAASTLHQLMDVLHHHNIETRVERDTAKLIDGEIGLAGPELAQSCDIIAVLGGDGTMLDAANRLGPTETPVAGINIGTLGFLTSCTDDELEMFAQALLSESYRIVPRMLLKATIQQPGKADESHIALNEITLTRGQTGRLVSLDAYIDGALLNHYRADGLIVATPTGSTAYSLAAGGPLISPIAGVFVITPICPHSLGNRSLVLADSSVVELNPSEASESPTLFTVDGRDVVEIDKGGSIRVEKAENMLHLIRLEGRSFFSALRQKLHWG